MKNPDKEMVKTYAAGQSYAASAIAAEYGVTAEVKAVNADGTEESLGADKAVAKWYRKEIPNGDIIGFPTGSEDQITQFLHNGALYTLITAGSAAGENAETAEVKVEDVGDYYLVSVYAGEEGLYAPAHSDPLKFTIDPVTVTLRPTEIGELNTGMTKAGLKKALAEAGSKLYDTDVNPAALSDAPVNKDPESNKDFYGVSYDDATVTQYYSPVFELVRFNKAKKAEDQNWPEEWSKTYETIDTAGDKNLPAGIELGDGKTVVYDYYVRFTGDKAVYDKYGDMKQASRRPITEATDAANRNYKVRTDDETLDKKDNMFRVEIKDVVKTEINVEEIIKSFKAGRGKDKEGTGLAVDSPAQTIYDMDAALFADRAAYKKAVVTANIKDSHEDITYEWQKSGYSLERYYESIRELTAMEKTEGETDEAFQARKEEKLEEIESGCTWTSQSDIPQDAGLYRLHITYKDSALVPTNAPAEGDAYFLIRQQELLFVADTQYAEYDQPDDSFLPQGTAYSVYLLPDNDESKLDLTKPLGWRTDKVHWNAMNRKKDGNGADTTEWELSYGDFKSNYVYKAAVRLQDSISYRTEIRDIDGQTVKNAAGQIQYWKNYTTQNTAVWNEETRKYEQHIKVGDGFGDIVFGAAKIQIDVDRSKIVDKTYDGVRSAGLPEGLVTLKNTDGTAIAADKLKVNEYADGAGTVEVAWKWLDFNKNSVANSKSRIVMADDVVYGGVYRLVARFDGYSNADGAAVYAPYDPGNTDKIDWVELTDADGNYYEWTINPLKITIAPDVRPEVTAGETLGEMAEDWHVIAAPVNGEEKIPDGTAENQEDDRWLFEKAETGSVWNAVTDVETDCQGGYPILGGTNVFTEEYYEDNVKVTPVDNHCVRFGKQYDIRLTKRDLWAQYQYSYDVTMKAAGPETIYRGDAEVRSTKFFGKGGDTAPAAESFVSVCPVKAENGIYQIQPREGIPFVYDDYQLMVGADEDTWENVSVDQITGKTIPLDKNYIAVNIVSPSEFSTEFTDSNYNFAKQNFVYENSIREAGGYVLKARGGYDSATTNGIKRYFITALFPVEQGSDGKIMAIPDFSVTWETGYTDTFRFDLTNAKLEANLKEAVAPKSIAFNGVQSKMAVGEEQQLDVKMTKAQLGDVVRIHYRLKDGVTSNEYASINPETGLLTALATANKKPVKVDIEAYPVRLAADGTTYEEITGKGVKIAKTKVTISEVTAPAIKKVIPQDTSVEVQFAKVDNGYRGELYVKQFADKKAAGRFKAADFETAIGKMKNGQWQDEFAAAPMYFSGTRGYDEKLKLCRQTVGGLEKGFYAVYVRNVSAVRTLADGTKTTESAAGSAKTFETTKSQVQNLMPYFEVAEGEKTKANPVRYYDEAQKEKPSKSSRHYMVELADKSAQFVVDGRFQEKPSNPAADAGDSLWLRLPLKTAETLDKVRKGYHTNTYLDPKLTYYVTDDENPRYDSNRKLLNPSKLVTISNKGKLTFKGVDLDGELTVRVYAAVSDSFNSGYYKTQNYCRLTITARPDTITTKKPKAMKVGDAIRLRDYIEYKKGKAKVPNYWSSDVEITNRADVEEAGYEIYQAKTDGETHPSIDGTLREGEYIIIARKNNAKKLDLIFTDWVWKAGSGASQTPEKVEVKGNKIALQAAKLDPVKGLKTVYTDDKAITINFTHPGHPEAFDVEVKDARGGVVYKRLVYRNSAQMAVVPADLSVWYGSAEVPKWLPTALTNLQRANLSEVNLTAITSNLSNRDFVFFEKNKTYAYTVKTEKLMRLSSYTVSVTPVYEGERAAKPASTKAKTTNIPASYADGDVRDPEQTFRGVVLAFNVSNLTNLTYLTSGNTYTVRTGVNGGIAQLRGTDTLTWKSSNTKVASIKANPGSFTATLKALQQGKTTITVTSKVTKKTIARYHIAVKAVGKANGYGGDYENGGNGFYDDFIITVDPYYEGRMEVLTVSNPVHVTSEDYLSDIETRGRTWVKFMAPSYGEYTFNCKYSNSSSSKNYKIYYSSGSEAGDVSTGTMNNRKLRLEEGQEIYFRIENQSYGFTLSVSSWTDFTKLTTAYTQEKPLTVGSRETWISFTAPEDNEYRFNSNKELSFEQDGQSVSINGTLGDGIYSYPRNMRAGESIIIKVPAGGSLWVTKREFIQTALTAGGSVPLSITKDNKNTVQYVKFTASATGEYVFTYSPSSKLDVTLTLQDGTRVDDGGMVVSEDFGKAKALNADGNAARAADEGTRRLFMQSGETIVIAIRALASEADSIVDDASKIDVTVQAAAPVAETALTVGEQTVKAATTQMFYFIIPNDTAVTKYSLTANVNADAIKWYYGRTDKDVTGSVYGGKELAKLSAIKNNGNSFTVENGGVTSPNLTGKKSLYAGDKIYLEVTAGEAADAKVTLTKTTAGQKTFDEATPATAGLTAANKAEWYTFTAKKTGYYAFERKVTMAPETAAAQSVTVETVDKVLDTVPNGVVSLSESPVLKKLEAGDYVFRIAADGEVAENVTATVTLSAKEIVPTVLAKGDNAVTIPKGETKYYSFKRAATDEYTVKWTPGTDTGTPTVEYTTGDLAAGSYSPYSGNLTVNNNYTYIIKITADNAKDLSGSLQIATKERKFLTNGETITFTKNGSEDYIFTTPEASELGYVVIAENVSAAAEGQTEPKIAVSSDGLNIPALGRGIKIEEIASWTQAKTDHTISITASDVTEAAEGVSAVNAAAKITIKPITAAALPEAAFQVKKDGEPRWFTYTIPADDRYVFDYAVGAGQDKNSVLAVWYQRNENGSRGVGLSTAVYLTKGQRLYARVAANSTIADAGVDVTLANPASLKTDGNTLTIEAGQTETAKDVTADDVKDGLKYYVFQAPAYAKYEVALAAGENSPSTPACLKYIPEGNNDSWTSGMTLEKDEEILIKVQNAGKLTVTQDAITQLKLDEPSAEITLAQNEEAAFVLDIFKNAYYDFAVSDAKILVMDSNSSEGSRACYQAEDRGYFVSYLDKEDGRYVFTVRNEGEESAKLKVTARELMEEPVRLKLGENTVPIKAGRVSLVEFKAPENYWYTVACSEGSALKELEGNDRLEVGEVFLKSKYNDSEVLYSGLVLPSGTGTVTEKITISKVAPQEASGTEIPLTLEPGESKWYTYQTDKAGAYTFTIPTDASVWWYYQGLGSKWDVELINACKYYLGEKADVIVKVKNTGETKMEGETGKITVAYKPPTELKTGENPLTGSADNVYLTFRAEEDGRYGFTSSGGSITYYGKNPWESPVSGTSHVIRKDDVVYLMVHTDSLETTTVTVTKTEPVQILDDVNAKSGTYQWVTYTAPKDGKYTFYSTDNSGDPKAWFFKNQTVGNNATSSKLDTESAKTDMGYGYDDDASSEGNNFLKELSLSAGETVYIAVGHYSLSGNISCYVCVEEGVQQ